MNEGKIKKSKWEEEEEDLKNYNKEGEEVEDQENNLNQNQSSKFLKLQEKFINLLKMNLANTLIRKKEEDVRRTFDSLTRS